MAGKCLQARRGHALTKAGHSEWAGHAFDKTKLCKFYAKGQCARGASCSFAHGTSELQAQLDLYKTELCFDYMKSGACKSGGACKFAHGPEELRSASVCQGSGRPTAPSGTSAVCRQIELLQQQARSLQQQLQMLQQLRAAPAVCGAPCADAPGPHSPCGEEELRSPSPATPLAAADLCSKDALDDCDFPDFSFSRQSTEEGELLPATGFSRQTSMESDDAWDDSELTLAPRADDGPEEMTTAAVAGISTKGLGIAASAGCALVVRNTFIDVEVAGAAAAGGARHLQRSRSLPAEAHRGSHR